MRIEKPVKHIDKPWGFEDLMDLTDRYAVKVIGFNKGARCSLQKHVNKCETIYVLSGKVMVEEDNANHELEEHVYLPGQFYTQRPGFAHRVNALEDSQILEFSTPELDDVIRIEDDYGRQDK